VKNNFIFSVVMAVYNTEDYVGEAIDSIINQTLNFEENTQIILVNDGSTDGSLDVLKKYQSQFPNNIQVLNQDNQGAAAARNHGLKYVKGKYVNFLDSDDYLDDNAFEEILKFFEIYYDSVDIVALPLVPFGRNASEHMLNYKFSETRLIDLTEEPNNPQLHISSSFIKYESIGDLKFPNVISSEDANFINKILLINKNLGVVKSSKYNYRKRDDVSSSLDNASSNVRYYTDRLKNHFLDLIDYCLEKEGSVPKFIQYMMIYDLYYLIKDTNQEVFDECIDKEEFMACIDKIFKHIDIDVIWTNANIKYKLLKKFLRYLKFKKLRVNPKKGTILLTGKKQIDKMSYHVFWLDIVKIKKGVLQISGYLNSLFNSDHISITAIKEDSEGNSEIIVAKPVFYTNRKNKSFISIDWLFKYNFDLNIPIKENENSSIKICVNYHIDGDVSNFDKTNIASHFLKVGFKKRADISKISNYFVKENHIVYFEDNKFLIKPFDFEDMNILEKQVQKRLLSEKKFSIYFLRAVYLFLCKHTSFFNKQIYLFIDRINEANDNSLYLFKHAIKQDDGIEKYFVLSKDCEDYKKVKKIGNVLSKNSFKYKLMFLFADKIISTHPYLSEFHPFYDAQSKTDSRPLVGGLANGDLYFLQHGVTKDDVSHWISKSNYNLSLLLTTSEFERDAFCGEGYGFDKEIIQDLGFPRFDNLKKGNSKNILIAPSWRDYLKGNKDKFLDSDYFECLNSLLSNQKLVDVAKKHGFNIIFKPHPELERYFDDSNRYVDLFDFLDEIDVKVGVNYSNLFNESQLLITDFSSVFFDFAYLKKPVIYYQPSENYHYKTGYFDYETMGFGDVIINEDELIEKIDFYLQNNCIMEDNYKSNVDKFFKYNDNKNCERVYNWIKKH